MCCPHVRHVLGPCAAAVPEYFNSYTDQNGHGPVDTGSTSFNNVMNSIFETPAAVALMACLLLDLTIPAAPGERAREAWQQQRHVVGEVGGPSALHLAGATTQAGEL